MSAAETAADQAAIDRDAALIMQHQRIPLYDGRGGQRCAGCDHLYGETDGPNSPRHAAHVAVVLAQRRAADICLTCSGGGRVLWVNAHGQPTDADTACPTCGGTGRAADTGDRETLARVRALPGEWQAATCITDGAPCSFHRHVQGYADDLRAALAGESRRDNERGDDRG